MNVLYFSKLIAMWLTYHSNYCGPYLVRERSFDLLGNNGAQNNDNWHKIKTLMQNNHFENHDDNQLCKQNGMDIYTFQKMYSLKYV